MKATFLSLLLILVTICEISSQSLNDFRTIASADWSVVGNWQMYDGSFWIPALYYPGNGTTNDVTILNGHTIVIDTSIITPNILNSLTIEGILEVDSDQTLNTPNVIITTNGTIFWSANSTLTLPLGSNLTINTGSPGLTSSGCNANRKLIIGSANYATCNGGGSGTLYSFSEINGIDLRVDPSSNTQINLGQTVTLFANPSGPQLSDNPITYNWTVTPPTGSGFSSTDENPTDVPTIAGTYIYKVVITNASGTKHTNSTTVNITAFSTKKVITNRRITFRVTNKI
ncbi:G8 domain-containing protein [Tenacibaculum adriaticum]|uniref:G8 domain-containing protein n=1 Tax=Tenacibaculum adriaticum TaxID=413713 RepID=A0A5S5DMB4_9FLAO|nr:G8 domain-containing protein [Tenacibaculum adriaticum]TYP96991.1 G8 domain-containing protein [Tenacibaculum adriaticum]